MFYLEFLAQTQLHAVYAWWYYCSIHRPYSLFDCELSAEVLYRGLEIYRIYPCLRQSGRGHCEGLRRTVPLSCSYWAWRVEKLHIEESANKAGAPQTVCLDVQSSVMISSGGITRENFSIGRLKFWLYLDIVANVIHQVCKQVSDFVVS